MTLASKVEVIKGTVRMRRLEVALIRRRSRFYRVV